MVKLYPDDQLFLEPLNTSHISHIFETIDRDRDFLRRWLPFVDYTTKIEDTRKFVHALVRKPRPRSDEVFTIWYRKTFAGLAGYKEIDRVNHKLEIGYWLAEEMQGKGIAINSVKKMVEYAFAHMNMNRIQIKCGVGNTKSSAIPKRLGFSFEGVERCGEWLNGRYIDLEIFSLLKAEWKKLPAASKPTGD